MEVDELIKALLSLSLSNDISFAKQIIYMFEENLITKETKQDSNCRIFGDRVIKSKEERNEISYSFKDFLEIFNTDIFEQNVLDIIGKEITLLKNIKKEKLKE